MTITAVGTVGTVPNYLRTAEGADITSFRVVVKERRFDEKARSWTDGDESWLTVTAFGKLALNAKESIRRGDRVLVTGRARLRDWQDDKGRSGSTLDVVADAVGPDLLWGTATYTRRQSADPQDAQHSAPDPAQSADWGAPAAADADPPF